MFSKILFVRFQSIFMASLNSAFEIWEMPHLDITYIHTEIIPKVSPLPCWALKAQFSLQYQINILWIAVVLQLGEFEYAIPTHIPCSTFFKTPTKVLDAISVYFPCMRMRDPIGNANSRKSLKLNCVFKNSMNILAIGYFYLIPWSSRIKLL